MTIQRVLVTSKPEFLHRHRPLFEAVAQQFDHLDYLPIIDLPPRHPWQEKLTRKTQRLWQKLRRQTLPAYVDPLKTAKVFIARSRHTERQIRLSSIQPDRVFHVFGMSSPFWRNTTTPYVMYLDYTMALAKRNWADWAPFANDRTYQGWLTCERRTYQRAHHLFCMSALVKNSLITDYKVNADKITVVGSSGNFEQIYDGEKAFGSQQILFNGSDFLRKGGDRVLAAFQQVRAVLPNATLVVIGAEMPEKPKGVINPGPVDSDALQNLFLTSDLVVAPGRCDPFPTFLMEAMNYGIPCIVSNQDGMPEIVDHDVNGIVLTQPTPDALANAIVSLLTSPERLQQMSEHARQKIKTQLNWNTIAHTIAQVIRS
ncbi:MAG: glycosyltransferase family 4 protein [Leptolyngbya sp. BL-A-14]